MQKKEEIPFSTLPLPSCRWLRVGGGSRDVFLSGGDEREALGGFAGHPLVPVEAVHHVVGDAVYLLHHGDSLRGVEGRVALAAALGVGDESPDLTRSVLTMPAANVNTAPIPRPIRGATGAEARVKSKVMRTAPAV